MTDKPDDTARTRQGPHTVRAGVMDALLGQRGPNGELMRNGQPAMVEDLPDDDEDADEAGD
jgi:hypothetical protein